MSPLSDTQSPIRHRYEIDKSIKGFESSFLSSAGSRTQDRDLKNILIHKNKAFLRKILQEWNMYTLKAFRKRMTKRIKKEKPKKKNLKIKQQPEVRRSAPKGGMVNLKIKSGNLKESQTKT